MTFNIIPLRATHSTKQNSIATARLIQSLFGTGLTHRIQSRTTQMGVIQLNTQTILIANRLKHLYRFSDNFRANIVPG